MSAGGHGVDGHSVGGHGRDRVVLLMGELSMLLQHPRLIEEVLRRDATPIAVFMTAGDTERFAALRADPSHELSGLGGVLRVADSTAKTVTAALAPLRERAPIAGAIPVGERFVEAAAVLADLIGLPGPGWRAAHVSRNKVLQRMLFADLSPASRPVLPDQRDALPADRLRYPAVVKPASLWGSVGVREVATSADLRRVVGSYPAEETLLVEDRVEGPEFSVESLVQGGKVLWAGITRKATNEADSGFFAETGHFAPADGLTAAREGALLAASAEIVRRLAVADGIVHCELRLAGDPGLKEVPVLMEVAVRMPPAISPLWMLATGEPLEGAVADIALGIPAAYPPPSRRAGQLWPDPPRGRLRAVACDGVEVIWAAADQRWPRMRPVPADAPARCCAVTVSRQPGDMLGPVSDNPSRSVSVIVDAPLDEPLAKIAAAAADAVCVEVGP